MTMHVQDFRAGDAAAAPQAWRKSSLAHRASLVVLIAGSGLTLAWIGLLTWLLVQVVQVVYAVV
jgi:hypothetical protein